MSDYTNILNRAAKFCSSGEKCKYDVSLRLIAWGLEESEAEKAIEYLERNGFIDDKRYARLFVHDKLKFNKWGRMKISYALKQKGISIEIINTALDNIDKDQYDEILDQLVLTKAKSLGSLQSYANKAKLLRFATQRGFLTDEIYSAIRRIEKE